MTADRIAPARRVAFDLLLELRRKPDSHSDALLRSRAVEALSPLDKNLATTLVMGVLRWRILLDQRIGAMLDRAGGRLPDPVQTALELGALQLLLLDRIPPHAAIFESVELAKQSGNPHAAGMVNAVLRKLVDGPRLQPPPPSRSAGEIARVFSHPVWMVERWAKAYGLTAAAAICGFDQQPPPLSVRLADPSAEALLALEEGGIRLDPGAFMVSARRVVEGEIASTRAFLERRIRIQDEGSQLIAELAAAALGGSAAAILDCCAAPGGKTAILAERNPRAALTACDISPSRLKTMRSFLFRQAGYERITFHLRDAAAVPYDRRFDLVLCDAPCSGTGTLARNPEIRHRIAAQGFERQHERQVKLLRSAMEAVIPGGRLVYSTCSLEPEENESVVAEALGGQQNFHLLSWDDGMRSLEASGILHPGSADLVRGDGFLRILPGAHLCDGFFAALIAHC